MGYGSRIAKLFSSAIAKLFEPTNGKEKARRARAGSLMMALRP
jgi:hypothetical protein